MCGATLRGGGWVIGGVTGIKSLRANMALWKGVKGLCYQLALARLSVGGVIATDSVGMVMPLAHRMRWETRDL